MSYPLAQPPPLYVRIHPDRARRIRSMCALVGIPLSIAAVVLGVVIIATGLNLPTARDPFNSFVWIAGAVAALCHFLNAIALPGARPYVVDSHLNLTGARITRRVLGGLWASSTVLCSLAELLFVLLVNSERSARRGIEFSAGMWTYAAVLALPAVLAGTAFFVARSLFGPSTTTPRAQPHAPGGDGSSLS